MLKKKFIALVCGYGVPKDILKDKSYHAYLTQVFNYLFDRYRDVSGVITMNGGSTDCYKPYRRTEAGEMAKWFRDKIASVGSDARKGVTRWKIVSRPRSLSSIENLLNFKPLLRPRTDTIIFCEKTRAPRIRRLAKQVFGSRKIIIVPIEFDGSPRRYQKVRAGQSEKDFERMELAALKNKKDLEKLRAFMKAKLRLMRRYSAAEAHRRLPEILEKLHDKYRD